MNLIEQKGKLYVPSSSKFCGTAGDLCLFRVDFDAIYQKWEETEGQNFKNRTKLPNIFAYYHLKFIKNDFGIGNYELSANKKSKYYTKTWLFLHRLRLIPLQNITSEVSMPLVTPSELNVKIYRNNFKKEALQYLKQQKSSVSTRDLYGEFKLILIAKYGHWLLPIYKKFKKILKI